MIRLNPEWTDLYEKYRLDHQDPRNQACHKIGIPMIVASFPVGATLVGLPLAATLFSVGWGFQFAGHVFEGGDSVAKPGRQASKAERRGHTLGGAVGGDAELIER